MGESRRRRRRAALKLDVVDTKQNALQNKPGWGWRSLVGWRATLRNHRWDAGISASTVAV
jgi:hypothetical protein